MSTTADQIIDAYGGTSAVARLLKLPPSTVHSWRRRGITKSRLHHLRLAADAAGIDVDHVENDTIKASAASSGNADDDSQQVAA